MSDNAGARLHGIQATVRYGSRTGGYNSQVSAGPPFRLPLFAYARAYHPDRYVTVKARGFIRTLGHDTI